MESAESYLAMSGFSKQGLYEQPSSPAGEDFSQAEAQYAVDHVDADWNQEAVIALLVGWGDRSLIPTVLCLRRVDRPR